MLLDKHGKVLIADVLKDGIDLTDQNLCGADFRGKTLNGLELSGSDLRGSDFSHCNLYWLNLFDADCNEVSFRSALLEGANMKSTCLRDADFSGAIIRADYLGKPSSVAHADLSGAKFADATVKGTEYDIETIFPSGFDPEQHGMVLVPCVDAWLVTPKCKHRST